MVDDKAENDIQAAGVAAGGGAAVAKLYSNQRAAPKWPVSLWGIWAVAIVVIFQWIPVFGILPMLLTATGWTVVAINGSMIGVACEAYTGRVSRYWIVLPFVFYGGYWTVAITDHIALTRMTARNDAANAEVITGFDPTRQVLVFAQNNGTQWIVQNFVLPVAYVVNTRYPEGYEAYRTADRDICTKVRESAVLQAAGVRISYLHEADPVLHRKAGIDDYKYPCGLVMPEEKPDLPTLAITQERSEDFEMTLPVNRLETIITMPDGQSLRLRDDFATPLRWVPMPIAGCFLNSEDAKMDCGISFLREAPRTASTKKGRRDWIVLARALGLEPTTDRDRPASDNNVILEKIKVLEDKVCCAKLQGSTP